MKQDITTITEQNAATFRGAMERLRDEFARQVTPIRLQAFLVAAIGLHNAGEIDLSQDSPAQVAAVVARKVEDDALARETDRRLTHGREDAIFQVSPFAVVLA